MATSRGGQATKPSKPKKAWVKPANWEAKTQARWLANHPQPLFPSTDISGKERAGLMTDARQQVTRSYAATPLPSAATYLQPFADAHARATAAGANYNAYLDSAAANAQNLSGAYGAALTGGINAGQAAVAAQGGSVGAGAPPPAASLIPAASVGSSFTNYLNAEKPYVGAAVNEQVGRVNAASGQAAGEYRQAEATRRGEMQDAIQKLYTSGLEGLQGQKSDAVKNAVAQYVALGKTAYQAAQLADRRSEFKTTSAQTDRKLDQADTKIAGTKAYQQATLDLKRKTAKATGIDLGPAYTQLFTTTPGTTGTTGKVGPAGQAGRKYRTVVSTTQGGVAVAPDKKTEATIMYGQTVPKVGTSSRVDPNTGNTITTTVVAGDYVKPITTGSAPSTRKATPAGWDRAVALLRAKYPGRITATWLKANFPPRPLGS